MTSLVSSSVGIRPLTSSPGGMNEPFGLYLSRLIFSLELRVPHLGAHLASGHLSVIEGDRHLPIFKGMTHFVKMLMFPHRLQRCPVF